MRRFEEYTRTLGVWFLIANFAVLGLPTTAFAGSFSTEAFIQKEGSDHLAAKQRANAILAQESVIEQMTAMGVDYDDVVRRVAALSDSELIALNGQLDELPAGSGVLAVIGVVFVVLLILELVGVTNIFTRV